MNISINKLLYKMEAELMEAKKMESDTKVRERIYAIKAICELILEETPATKSITEKPTPIVMRPVELPKQNRIKEEDGANGDSLFDF